MKTTLTEPALGSYLAKQLDHFFPDGATTVEHEILKALPLALERMSAILHEAAPRLFEREGAVWFNHLHSDQWAMFLYLLGHELARAGGSAEVATKLYLLNKALHGIDVFYEVRLPRYFLFMHPLGTVLGRANYADYFVVLQNCTVGNVGGQYPSFGKGVMICAGASILGPAIVGEDVTIGAGSLIVNTDVPARSTAVGRGKEIRFISSETPLWRRYFRV